MKKKPSSIVFMGVVAALWLTSFAVAQQPGTSAGQGKQQQQQGGMMSMDDMMKTCREHCQRTTTSIDQLSKQLQQAQQSNDPAKMRNHMSMMQNMQGMHGGMGSMMQQQGKQAGGK